MLIKTEPQLTIMWSPVCNYRLSSHLFFKDQKSFSSSKSYQESNLPTWKNYWFSSFAGSSSSAEPPNSSHGCRHGSGTLPIVFFLYFWNFSQHHRTCWTGFHGFSWSWTVRSGRLLLGRPFHQNLHSWTEISWSHHQNSRHRGKSLKIGLYGLLKPGSADER